MTIAVILKTTDDKLKVLNINNWRDELAGKMILLFT